ncbi:HAD-IA family hydrolase [Kordiimonas marina]|uniref:HAD-IA family hydrolase n=1 Tax=Kordiimonas marina TaxID=2872312 RepID=UPI001FF452FD|nr:HAD-IA family hydrolase [Kordiimonas marina]MCJ9430382.1 HAD-IA family hydrolase [Kordiimonas marina]
MTAFTAQKIIFDLDGTLVDSAPDLYGATNHVLASVGRASVTLDQVRHMVGLGARKLIELGLEATGGMDGHSVDDLLPVFLAYYGEHIADGTDLFPGAEALLADLRDRGFGVALCTNKPIGLTEQLLEELDIRGRFDAIAGGDSFAFRKPDGRHILETAAMVAGDGPLLMVGDSATDVNAARDAKVPCIAVDFGYSTVPAAELGADHLISHLGDISSLVTR